MSLITVVPAEVAVDEVIEQFTGPCDSQLELGDVVTFDPSSGKLVKADASTDTNIELYGIVVSRQAQAYTAIAQGVIALGRTAFASLNFGDLLYLSDTAGRIDTTAGTQSVTLGQVIPVWNENPAGRLFRVAPVRSENVTIDGDLVVDGTLGATGAATLSSTLGVVGDTTLTGDLAVNGGDFTSTATVFNLLDDTVETLSIGGAATVVDIGAATGTTSVKNDLAVAGTAAVTGATTLTGALTANNAVFAFPNIPTSDPSVVGQIWANSNVLTISV